MSKPITPDEVAALQLKTIPGGVFDAFNELIAQRSTGGNSIMIKQNEVIALICAKTGASRQEVFDKGWLNVEPAYRDAGWSVEYDKPAYNESYEANFTFKRKR
jgi:hypothetical protein